MVEVYRPTLWVGNGLALKVSVAVRLGEKYNDLSWLLLHRECNKKYSGPPLMRPPLGNWKTGRIRGVAAGEG